MKLIRFSLILAALVAAFVLSVPAWSQGLVWSRPGPSGLAVSVGDSVCTASGLGASYTRTHALGDGSQLWQESSPGMSWHWKVASGGSVHASVFDADVPGTSSMAQRVYLRMGSVLYQFPNTVSNSDRLGVAVSRNGGVVAAFSNSDLMVLTGGAQLTVALGFTALGIDLSADGTTLLVTGDMATRVFAVPSLAVLYSATPSSFTFHAQAISGDGGVFAIGRIGRVDVFRRQAGGGYAFAFAYLAPSVSYCDRLDVSDDGSTLVAGFDFFDTNRKVSIDVVDLETGLAWNRLEFEGPPTLTNFVGEVGISADGSVAAAGMWGDGAGPLPELVFLRRGVLDPIASCSIDGSVCDLDLSADGSICAVGTKDGHATAGPNYGSVALYRVLPAPAVAQPARASTARVRRH